MYFKGNLLFILFIITFSNNLKGQSVEYSVKASLIEKFARFTEWESSIVGENFVIDILGESPFNGELERLAKKYKLKNKPIVINYITNYQDANNCQVLFICTSEKRNIQKIIDHLKSSCILTVAETPLYSKKGVHFNFYVDETQTIRFEINPTALKNSKLIPDMQLLSIGKIIN